MTPTPRPDPAQGVFETLLVLDGGVVALEPHLDRLAASVASLYAAELPAEAAEGAVRAAAARVALGRVRLTVSPRGSGLAWEAIAAEIDPSLRFPPPAPGAALGSHVLPGGLGAHKWADRSGLPEGEDGTVPLLLDDDGEVLETGRSNVFAVVAGGLATPPADGRILPGITRALAIELARAEGIAVAERPLGVEDLLAAEEVLLTNSIRGVEPASTLDGSPLGPGQGIGQRLANRLRGRWEAERRAPAAPRPA